MSTVNSPGDPRPSRTGSASCFSARSIRPTGKSMPWCMCFTV